MRRNFPEPRDAIGRQGALTGAYLTVSLAVAVAILQHPVPMAFPRAEAGRGPHARHTRVFILRLTQNMCALLSRVGIN